MKYKVIVNGEAQAIWNSDKHWTLYSDTMSSSSKDKVILRFDEERDSFIAKIENPSPKTLRLFNAGKLGFGITKCNFGKKDHWHASCNTMSSVDATFGHYWDKNNYKPIKNRAKAWFHPRWSRMHNNLIKVEDMDFIEVPARSLRYSMHHSYNKKTIVWNFYRGLLIKINGNPDNINTVEKSCSYGYKTNCKSLKLNYDKSTGKWSNVESGQSLLDVQVTDKGNNTYQIFINNITGSFLNMYQNNRLMIGTKYECPKWASGGRGGAKSSNHRRDDIGHRRDMWNENPRYKYVRLDNNGTTVSNLMFKYTVYHTAIGRMPHPHESLTWMTDSYAHNTHDVKITGRWKVVLYYADTGHTICTLVEPNNSKKYVWYEDPYWGDN